jgi:hypothetical protein
MRRNLQKASCLVEQLGVGIVAAGPRRESRTYQRSHLHRRCHQSPFRVSPGHPRSDAVEPLRSRLSADLLTAMKARDKETIATLRCLLAALDNAGAQDPKAFGSSTEVPRKSLTQDELRALMNAEVTSRRTAIIDYERGGRHQDAARLEAELILISRYLM